MSTDTEKRQQIYDLYTTMDEGERLLTLWVLTKTMCDFTDQSWPSIDRMTFAAVIDAYYAISGLAVELGLIEEWEIDV